MMPFQIDTRYYYQWILIKAKALTRSGTLKLPIPPTCLLNMSMSPFSRMRGTPVDLLKALEYLAFSMPGFVAPIPTAEML